MRLLPPNICSALGAACFLFSTSSWEAKECREFLQFTLDYEITRAERQTIADSDGGNFKLAFSEPLAIPAGTKATVTRLLRSASSWRSWTVVTGVRVTYGGIESMLYSENNDFPVEVCGPVTIELVTELSAGQRGAEDMISRGDPLPQGSLLACVETVRPILTNDASFSPGSGTAVVIPEDPDGRVEIILEQSADLVTWTRANPGTYLSRDGRRFFRLRAVRRDP